LGHVFRAGEVGRWHNPEFTMLEWYRPGWSMAQLITEVEHLLVEVAGIPALHRVSFQRLFFEHTGLDAYTATAEVLATYARDIGIAPQAQYADDTRAFWLDLIMSVQITPALGRQRPICVHGFPADDAVLIETEQGADNDLAPIARRFEI